MQSPDSIPMRTFSATAYSLLSYLYLATVGYFLAYVTFMILCYIQVHSLIVIATNNFFEQVRVLGVVELIAGLPKLMSILSLASRRI